MMLIITTISILVVMALALARALLGPSLFDRILAVNMFGTKTVLFICVVGYLDGRPDFIDIALIYALVNFIGTVAVLHFFEYNREHHPATEDSDT